MNGRKAKQRRREERGELTQERFDQFVQRMSHMSDEDFLPSAAVAAAITPRGPFGQQTVDAIEAEIDRRGPAFRKHVDELRESARLQARRLEVRETTMKPRGAA